MAFYPKLFDNILLSMLNWFRSAQNKITDFNIGSKTRTTFEAVSVEIEQVYFRIRTGLLTGIDDAVFNAFEFPLRDAQYATTTAQFSRVNTVGTYTIFIGTQVATNDNVIFEVTVETDILDGNATVDVPVKAAVAGTNGNVPANTIGQILTPVQGVTSVTNLADITNGRNLESKDSRKRRFARYIDTLARATNDAIAYAATSVTDIVGVSVIESPEVEAWNYDGTYTDFTDTANLPYEQIFEPIQDGAAGNIFYIGTNYAFDSVYLNFQQNGSAGNGEWEYSNAAGSWSSLTVTDQTNKLQQTGSLMITTPLDWAQTSEGGNLRTGFYIRFRVTGSYITRPKIHQLFLSPVPGIVDVYAHDGSGDLSSSLEEQVLEAIGEYNTPETDKYRGSGIKVRVKPPIKITQDINVSVLLPVGADITILDRVEDTINTLMLNKVVSEPLIYSELIQRIMNTDDANILRTEINIPTDDIYIARNQILRAGTVTVNQL